MFSNFSLNKLTNSISTAVQSVEENIKTNSSILTNDSRASFSLRKTTRFLQEKVGGIPDQDISKLPESYTALEAKTDQYIKILKRIHTVTKTFEIDGYDYPPNLTESVSSWFSDQSGAYKDKDGKIVFSKSFSSAIAKAAFDSKLLWSELQKKDAAQRKETAKVSEDAADNGKGKGDEAENVGDDSVDIDEDEDEYADLIGVFDSWFQCYHSNDKAKALMDKNIILNFNRRLERWIDVDYRNIMRLRRKVQDSRLEFDTMRYDVKQKGALQSESKAPDTSVTASTSTTAATTDNTTPRSAEEKQENEKEAKTGETKSSEEPPREVAPEASAEEDTDEKDTDKLLEKLEDRFVSDALHAGEAMLAFTDSAELILLIKTFQTAQLEYYKKCVANLETSLAQLAAFEPEDDTNAAASEDTTETAK